MIPTRTVDPIFAPFWDAVSERKLVLQHCRDCGDVRFPPAQICPKCLSAHQQWREASGCGTLHSWIAFHRAYWDRDKDRVPYEVCLVKLDEGPLMISNFAGPHNGARLGTPMRLEFVEQPDGSVLPNFAVAPDDREVALGKHV